MQTGNAAVALRIGSGSALKVEVEADVQHDSDGGGRRGGQTDHSQARIGLDAHEVGHGQAYQQGLHQTLHHDPDSLVVAVETTHHAEQHSSGDGLWREAFQIGESVCDRSLGGCQNYRAFSSIHLHLPCLLKRLSIVSMAMAIVLHPKFNIF